MNRESFLRHKKAFHDHNQKFLEVTHRSLSSYWDINIGLNLSKFMVDFFPEYAKNELSAEQMITDKWGEDFTKIIKELL